MTTEEKLIKRILEGNQEAYTEFVKQYQRLVWHMVARILDDEEDIKDVSQDVFIQIFKKLKNFKQESKLATWIATIAWRYAINYLKKRRGNDFTDIQELNEYDTLKYSGPDREFAQLDYDQKVHLLIDSLPVHYKTILTLYHINEFNYKEIEEITGYPEGTVKNYLFRARKLLKEKVENTTLGMELKLP
ncbi:MAG TPA: RNA polymerase subunit sigma-24 [Cytophagales bacterium]|jgi:RNA polymerase sigma factor (sigma-70 family)|nr:RNA polymerase subunit sigma-24 [Cytophagales bacterium]